MKNFTLSEFWFNTLKLISANVISQVIVILTLPFITRLYQPEHIGVLSVINSIVGVVIIILALRIDRAIVLEKGKESVKLFEFTNFFGLLFIVFIAVMGYLFVDVLQSFFLFPSKYYFYVIPVILLLQFFYNQMLNLNNSFAKYSIISLATIILSPLLNINKLILGNWYESSTDSLLIAEVLGLFSVNLLVYIIARKQLNFNLLIIPKKQYTKSVFVKYQDFIKYDIVNSFLNVLSWMMPTFLISYFFNNTLVGYYALGFTALRLPMNLIGKSISTVFYKAVSDAKDNMEETRERSLEVLKLNLFFGLIPTIIIFLFGDEIFELLFGSEWREAGVYSRILSFWTLFWLISSPISTLYYTLNEQRAFLKLMLASVILRVLAFIIGGQLDDIYMALILFSVFSIGIYLYQLYYLFEKIKITKQQLTHEIIKIFKYPFLILLIGIFFKFLNLYIFINISILIILFLALIYFKYQEFIKKVIL